MRKALESVHGTDFGTLCNTVKKTAFKLTRVGQLVAREASERLGITVSYTNLGTKKLAVQQNTS